MLFQLPDLCLANIADQLCAMSTPIETLHMSVALCKTSPSNECNTMVSHIYNFLDPGCVDELNAKVVKRAHDVTILNDIVAAATDASKIQSYSLASLAELKEECILKNIPKTGTKAKLVENLVRLNETQARHANIVLSRLRAISNKMNPLRPRVCELLLNSTLTRSNSTLAHLYMITATNAKLLGADELMLNGLVCEYHRNPHNGTHHSPPMRLFVKSEVMRAIFKRDGPGTLNIQDATAMLEAVAENEKMEFAKSKRRGKRSVQLDQFLTEFGLSQDDTCTRFYIDIGEFIGGRESIENFRANSTSVLTRLATMISELANLGCALRSDSKLCETFIKHDQGSAVEIAKVMCEMKFYHEHTTYSSILDNMFQQYSNRINQKYQNSGHNDSDADSDSDYGYDAYDVGENAKFKALSAFLKSFPSVSLALASPDVPETIRTVCIVSELKKQMLAIVEPAMKLFKGTVGMNLVSTCFEKLAALSYLSIEAFDRSVFDEYISTCLVQYNKLKEKITIHTVNGIDIEFDIEASKIMFESANEKILENAFKRHNMNKTRVEFGIKYSELSNYAWAQLLQISDKQQQEIEMRRYYVEHRCNDVVISDFFESVKVAIDDAGSCRVNIVLAGRETVNAWILAKRKNQLKTRKNVRKMCPQCPHCTRTFCEIGLAAHTAAVH